MKKFLTFSLLLFSFSQALAGYDCFTLESDGSLSENPSASISSLSEDSSLLQSAEKIIFINGETYFKYQYWADAGDGYHLVHFVGIESVLDEDEGPQLITQNLLCKKDDSVEEGGLPDDDLYVD